MTELFKSLRHPSVDRAAEVWRTAASGVDLTDHFEPSIIPDAPSKSQILSYGNLYESPSRLEIRSLVLRAALQTYAKSLEVADAAVSCREAGQTASSLLLSYDAAYFAARALALALGFSPTDANSEVTVDVLFSFGKVARSDELVEDNFAYFVASRWEHKNVWTLAARIVGTISRFDEIEPALKFLRSDKLKDVTKVRNKQAYSSALYAGDIATESDFPDALCVSSDNILIVCRRYREIFQNLSVIISEVFRRARLDGELALVASSRRLERSKLL